MTRDKFETMLKEMITDYYNERTDGNRIDKNNLNKYILIISRKDTLDFYRIEMKLRKTAKGIYVGLYNKKTKDIYFNVYMQEYYEKIPFVKEGEENV